MYIYNLIKSFRLICHVNLKYYYGPLLHIFTNDCVNFRLNDLKVNNEGHE